MKKVTLPLLFAIFTILPSSNLFSQENQKLISDYIHLNHHRDFTKSNLIEFIIDNVDVSKSLKGEVIKFEQSFAEIPIYNSVGTVLVRNGKIDYYTDSFIKNYNYATDASPAIEKKRVLELIADDLGKNELKSYQILSSRDADPLNGNFVKQRLVYFNEESDLKLAYQFTFQEPKSNSFWEFLIDAHTGTLISKSDLNLSCTFHPGAYSHDHEAEISSKFVGPRYEDENKNYLLFLPDNASYNVFALPIEAPTFGSRTLVSNPWIQTSSPEGWHYDGTSHYFYTRGNNVYAYEDVFATNFAGSSADGGTARNFNFPFSINADAATNQNASITNLFYVNNMVHDIFYKFGFTESAKNFQQNNFGLGGFGNDYVNAEAQDGAGTNNANFSSPPDGSKPRMQMFLWSTVNRLFYYNAPVSAIPRQPIAGIAQFGLPLDATGVTGNIQLAAIINGCTALPTGSLNGKIGLVERGVCDFASKVKNVQNAGGVAAIIYNAPTSTAIGNMAGTDATITIPSVLIENTEGEFIKTQLSLNTTVNVTLKNDPAAAVTPDGSFDNGIVIHEYGHGISNRLTGAGSSCLNSSISKEQMGEGWSDFFALMLTNRPGDNASVARGIGTYAAGESISGGGIRPAKYSPNFAINNFTYGNTNGLEYNNGSAIVPDVHSIGFIWATMLWDLHWDYVAKYGYAADVTANTTSGSARVLQLVTNALKLQACNPSFVEGRDAILAAELATTQGADRCMIWRAFAKRGLGNAASAGLKGNINDQEQSFTVPADCVLSTNETASVKDNAISIYPNPAKNEFFISFPKNTLGKVNVEIYDMSGKLVSTESKISPDAKKAISTSSLTNGTYLVKVNGIGINTASKVIINK